jgi:glycine cleavage system transcriptional repressor
MGKKLVMTLTGHDRVGIVDEITSIVLNQDGNVEASRMARLESEFAMLMLISVAHTKYETLFKGLDHLKEEGYNITVVTVDRNDPKKYSGWIPYQLQVSGADHEGIIHTIAHHLAEKGINIESMDTSMMAAPVSGTTLFMMTALIYAPPDQPYHKWKQDLWEISENLNIDTEVSPYTGERK